MPEVAESPKAQAHISPFKADPEFARQAAYKAHQAIADLKADGERFREWALEQAKAGPAPKPIEQTEALQEAIRQIELCNEQIERTRERLNDDNACYCEECERGGLDDKARAALLRELRGLMEHLCRLHNIAQAPTSRVNPKPQKAVQTLPRPTPIEPTPQPVVSSPGEPEPNG